MMVVVRGECRVVIKEYGQDNVWCGGLVAIGFMLRICLVSFTFLFKPPLKRPHFSRGLFIYLFIQSNNQNDVVLLARL